MVDLREEANSDAAHQTSENIGFRRVVETIKEKKIDVVLWMLRLVTMIFGILFIIPVGVNPSSCYQKAFVAGAATHMLRLHQRLNGFRFSMQFLQQMFWEDACHYLLYCLMFIGMHPVTMALMPIFFFALLHWTSFSIQLLNMANFSESWMARLLNRIVEQYSQTCLQIIACCEIFLMPTVIVMLFSGQGNLLVPFVYYRFLTLRYLSRRNPSNRQAFQQLRMIVEEITSKAACPNFVRSLAFKAISLVGRLAPQTASS